MALPLAPLAGVALRYAAISLAIYAATQARAGARRDQRTEDALDEMPEGLSVGRDGEAMRGGGRWRRTIRLGASGPGVEVDLAALGRVRMRRV